nr:amsh-like protease sst2 [Quercus suber]
MALSRHHVSFDRPQNVPEIVSEAETFEYSHHRSLQAWLRSARMLNIEAVMCENDGNLQLAYLYLYRHANLVYGKLPSHPDFRNPAFRKDVSAAQNSVKANLVKLEQWKPVLNRKSQLYAEATRRRNEVMQTGMHNGSIRRSAHSKDVNDPTGDDQRSIGADEHRDLVVDLAQREIRRRSATRDAERPGHGTRSNPRKHAQTLDRSPDGPNHLSKSIQQTGAFLDNHRRSQRSMRPRTLPNEGTQSYSYPVVPAKESEMHWKAHAPHPDPSSQAPRIPSKVPRSPSLSMRFDPVLSARTPNDPPAPESEPQYSFRPISFTESGTPLRTLLLPPTLRTSFLNVADANTARNLETCGILCGTAIRGALFITHLVFPDQTASSDTCDTTDDGDAVLFDFCDAHALLVCGWIHTHPSQSCFLSSRDLHTSAGYQIMLPEAIAIVCAPRHNPDWGIFRLTDPPGLGAVLDCVASAPFHPHAEANLYTDALRPGHVVEGVGLEFEVVDLRRNW